MPNGKFIGFWIEGAVALSGAGPFAVGAGRPQPTGNDWTFKKIRELNPLSGYFFWQG